MGTLSNSPAILDAGDRIDSWKEIANYLNRNVRTVQRWENISGLPVHRRNPEEKNKGSVCAYKSELDAWMLGYLNSSSSEVVFQEAKQIAPSTGQVVVPSEKLNNRVVALVIGGLVLLSLIAEASRHVFKKPLPTNLVVTQMTDYAGAERYPAFSPDGQKVAFSWNGKEGKTFNIYTRSLAAGPLTRLTDDAGDDVAPSWSRDGRSLGFFRKWMASSEAAAVVVPATGGKERLVAKFPLLMDVDSATMTLDWTADCNWLIVPSASARDRTSLMLVSPVTLESRSLTTMPSGSQPDCCPALSPDGRTLAFLRATNGGTRQIFLLSLTEDNRPMGQPRQITSEISGVLRPSWAKDGHTIFYVASTGGRWLLRAVPIGGNLQPVDISSLQPNSTDWTLVRGGSALAYSNSASRPEVWRMELSNSAKITRLVSSSSSDNLDAQYSPDGSRVAFVSVRARESELWVTDPSGSNGTKVATIPLRRMAPPRWSPDGQQLAFECINDGNQDICIVPAAGGAPRRLTADPGRDTLPSWSNDGQFVYVTSDRSGMPQIWKIPASSGDAGAIQLTRWGGYGALESPDGKEVYYVRGQQSGTIFRMSSWGGPEFSMEISSFGPAGSLAVTSHGLYYPFSDSPDKGIEIQLYSWKTHKSTHIARIESRMVRGLSVSPDGRSLLYAAYEPLSSDLYMSDLDVR